MIFPKGGDPRVVLGPNFSIAAAAQVRISDPLLSDDDGTGEAPPSKRTLRLETHRFAHQWFATFHIAPTLITFTDLETFRGLSYSGALLLYAGVRKEWLWWSRPGDITTKNLAYLGLGITGGYGIVSERNDSAESPGDDSAGAGIAGLAIQVGVVW
ncbi:hypothetical protein HPP05_14825 [Corallococcus exiguus]|uniref:hypothetical protein n=1 Tax=Corallococcus exiguus TaxID=83462 RepID=UPI001494CA82|nr:hypothetical protein [Corallococcus exiguus]NPC71024.1 hypothetical protein [Corallococcus exiguus]